MNSTYHVRLDETVYNDVLPNGLSVTVVPKPEFKKNYALFTTQYGSVDNEFVPMGMQHFVRVPDGIAHFLEHKMFEKEDGDVFQKFGELGASANAFTSFTKTSYLFSTTDNVYENLEVLLDFVQSPYFTEETVNKEKGIIAQEIQMYQDDPDWQLSFGLLQNLFPTHPMHIDIAGTVKSIQHITAEDLYLCYDTFYHPSNMTLLIVGNVDPDMALTFVRENQAHKDFIAMPPIKRRFPQETPDMIVPTRRLHMPISQPKMMVGGRYFGPFPKKPLDRRRFQYAVLFGLSLLFGNTSRNYSNWYESEMIDDSFGYEFSMERDICFFSISGDTYHPELLAQQVEAVLYELSTRDLTVEKLEILKKKQVGQLMTQMNSVEFIAQHFDEDLDGVTIFDLPDLIESITINDVKAALNQIIRPETMSKVFMDGQLPTKGAM